MKTKIKRYITVVIGTFLVALAFNLFLSPYNLASNGISGLAIIINRLTGINEGVFVLIVNIFLLGVSYNFLGRKKTKHSLIGSLLLPVFISITAPVSKYIVLKDLDLLIIALLGGIISGIGYGLIYQHDYTTGGTDILNQLMEKYYKIPMNKAILYIDGMVVLLGGVVFGFSSMLYSMIVLYIISELSNRTMLKINQNQILLVQSKKIDQIKEYISKEYYYDSSILNSTGGYTKEKQKTLFCAVSKRDYYPIKEGILFIDPKAFITIITAYEEKNGNISLKKDLKKINTQNL